MAKFIFYKDYKIEGWQRDTFVVEAEDELHARLMVEDSKDPEDAGTYAGTEDLKETFVKTGEIEVLDENEETLFVGHR